MFFVPYTHGTLRKDPNGVDTEVSKRQDGRYRNQVSSVKGEVERVLEGWQMREVRDTRTGFREVG